MGKLSEDVTKLRKYPNNAKKSIKFKIFLKYDFFSRKNPYAIILEKTSNVKNEFVIILTISLIFHNSFFFSVIKVKKIRLIVLIKIVI